MDVVKEAVEEFFNGHATAGTTKSKLTDLSFPLNKGVLIRCPGGSDPVPNTAPVWIGGQNVTANSNAQTGGVPILPGDVLFIPIDKPSKLWVISTGNNQDVAWMGI